jgi:ATPase subunit of ABC transporter with duplicated ATPase domains
VPSIHLRGLSYAHTAATSILVDVDLDLAADPNAVGPTWVGVVGANGGGKSTLLRLFAGQLSPTTGSLDVHSAMAPRLVPQAVQKPSDDIRAFAATWEAPAVRLRRRLALDPDDLEPSLGRGWSTLSPGMRKRWQLAAALADDPDLLLLDEPTNHLDVASRDLLVRELRRFAGLGLVVSHDRSVLESLTGRTLRVHGGQVTLHSGAYAAASERWRTDEQAQRTAHDRAASEVRRERRILGEVRRDRHGAEAGPRRDRRLAGADQPDAREAGRKFAARKAEAALARRVGQQHARVARAERTAEGFDLRRRHDGPIGFRPAATGRRTLVHVRGDIRHAGGEVHLRDVDVALIRGDRVHLAGANGAGKTTLIDALLVGLASTGEQVAVLPQELDDPGAEVARVRSLDPTTRGRVLGTVATLGVDPDRVLVTGSPSPGEARKLVLARILQDEASVLVLDEPTNHLDLPSIERLQAALSDFSGALLLVTHDDALAAATTTSRWEVGGGQVRVRGLESRR